MDVTLLLNQFHFSLHCISFQIIFLCCVTFTKKLTTSLCMWSETTVLYYMLTIKLIKLCPIVIFYIMTFWTFDELFVIWTTAVDPDILPLLLNVIINILSSRYMYISISEKLMILFSVHGHLLSLFVYQQWMESSQRSVYGREVPMSTKEYRRLWTRIFINSFSRSKSCK